MVGDGRWLTVGEAAEALGGVHPQTVRRYVADDLLRSERLAGGHRRIDAASVQELLQYRAMLNGLESVTDEDERATRIGVYEAAKESLRRHNRGEGAPTIRADAAHERTRSPQTTEGGGSPALAKQQAEYVSKLAANAGISEVDKHRILTALTRMRKDQDRQLVELAKMLVDALKGR